MSGPGVKLEVRELRVRYRDAEVLKGISFDVLNNEILAVIGPANSGKSTLLIAINRMVERIPAAAVTGSIRLDGKDVREFRDVEELRRRIGMVFAVPVPLPMSIRDNVLFGPRLQRRVGNAGADELVERSLRAAFLWDEVKDRLGSSGLALSGGQQQRLCLARTLAVDPDVIMLDEPCSGLDPISTAQVEEALRDLRRRHTIILVTNNTKQASRVGDRTAFLLMGEMIEIDDTEVIFTRPARQKTEEYVTGRFG
ncbi:MAG: phosphate ABC transporter ATP-binding protein [Acidobacteria bacterium]|nr:phosphate ABC transporter ATP-binding protein [Acidobacteriota bacterium]